MIASLLQKDIQLFFILNAINHPIFDSFFSLFLLFGNTFGTSLIVLGLIFKYIPKKHLKRTLGYCALSLLICFGVNQTLKTKIPRFRPAEYVYQSLKQEGLKRNYEMTKEEFMELHGVKINIIGPFLKSSSFPSGHTLSAFSGATMIFMILGRKFWWIYLYALLVGYSRIYVSAHFPLDVLVGGIIGTIFTIIPLHFYKKRPTLKRSAC